MLHNNGINNRIVNRVITENEFIARVDDVVQSGNRYFRIYASDIFKRFANDFNISFNAVLKKDVVIEFLKAFTSEHVNFNVLARN